MTASRLLLAEAEGTLLTSSGALTLLVLAFRLRRAQHQNRVPLARAAGAARGLTVPR